MILRHQIENFKSFKKAIVKFEDFNLLIGKNAAGKTNLVQSLDFLAHIVREKSLVGARKFLNVTPIDTLTNIKLESNVIAFEIDLEVDSDVLSYRIEIKESDNNPRSLTVLNEKLVQNESTIIFERKENNVVNGNNKNIPLSVENTDLAVSLIKDGAASIFRTTISRLFLSNNIDFEERDFASLNPKHLPSLLNHLYEKKGDEYKNFEIVAKKVIPGFNGFATYTRGEKSAQGTLLFLLRQIEGESYFSTYASSTGDMKTMYILAALFSKTPNSTLIIEELENGLHPERMKLLLDYIQRIASKRDIQLIITTHSPNVIGVSPLNKIQFIYLDDGESKIIRIEDHMTKAIREQLENGGDVTSFLKTLNY